MPQSKPEKSKRRIVDICAKHYHNYKRTFDELISSEADTSPYAQTGISVWDIAAFKDTVLITHDIERFSPLIFDVVFLK